MKSIDHKAWKQSKDIVWIDRDSFRRWTPERQTERVLSACMSAAEEISDFRVSHKKRADMGTLAILRICISIIALRNNQNRLSILSEIGKSCKRVSKSKCIHNISNALFWLEQNDPEEAMDYLIDTGEFWRSNIIASLESPLYKPFSESEYNFTTGITHALRIQMKEAKWDFWHEWYNYFLNDTIINEELQHSVALIPNSDWEKGAEHIAQKIDEIKAKLLIEQTPLAETIEFNEAQQKFIATPTPISNSRLLSTNLTLISDALDEAMLGNGLRPDCWEDRTLRKTIQQFANDPERIEMDCMRVHRRLTAKLGNELPESDELVDLSTTLLDVALDIRANHPEIAENRAKRTSQAVQEASPEQKTILQEALPHIRAITDDNLGAQFADDIGEILEGELLSKTVATDPVIRTGNRLAKIWLLARKLDARVAASISALAETSKEITTISIALAAIYSLLSFLF